MATDTERLDFLEKQRYPTFWIGYDSPAWQKIGEGPWKPSKGHTASPVFGGAQLRAAIDGAMECAARQSWLAPDERINEVR